MSEIADLLGRDLETIKTWLNKGEGAGLERELRRRLGNQQLLARALRSASAD